MTIRNSLLPKAVDDHKGRAKGHLDRVEKKTH